MGRAGIELANSELIDKQSHDAPISGARLVKDLRDLGVEQGMTVTMHSSLSSLGWVIGGAETVVRSALAAVGPRGTLVMPAATPQCADPATWSTPRLPPEWLPEVRGHMPLFDQQTTPTTLGAVPETFRNWPGTLRSDHPLESVCAHGPNAELITRSHPLAFSEGRKGPFGRLHELESKVVLLGVGFNRCTALHYAESLASNRRESTVRFLTLRDGTRHWLEVPNVADDLDTHFPVIGAEYVSTGRPRCGRVGEADAILVEMGDLVAFAVDYFERAL